MVIKSLTAKFNKFKFLSSYISEKSLSQFKKYLVIGLLSFGIEELLLYTFKEHLKLHYLISTSVAYPIVFWLNFLLNRFWSFKSTYNFGKQLLLYSALFAINFAINYMLMYSFTSLLNINYLISKVFVMCVITVWNFIIYKKVIYKY